MLIQIQLLFLLIKLYEYQSKAVDNSNTTLVSINH